MHTKDRIFTTYEEQNRNVYIQKYDNKKLIYSNFFPLVQPSKKENKNMVEEVVSPIPKKIGPKIIQIYLVVKLVLVKCFSIRKIQ